MRTAEGSLNLVTEKLVFEKCYPVSICSCMIIQIGSMTPSKSTEATQPGVVQCFPSTGAANPEHTEPLTSHLFSVIVLRH